MMVRKLLPPYMCLSGLTFNVGVGTFRRAMGGFPFRLPSSYTRATVFRGWETGNSSGRLSGATFNIGVYAFRRMIVWPLDHQVAILGIRVVSGCSMIRFKRDASKLQDKEPC